MIYIWIKRLFKKKQYVQLECLNDRIVITDGEGKMITEYVLKEMRID
jgi:hypothetical protein